MTKACNATASGLNDAPERILVSKCGKTLVHDGMKQYETDVQYIRADTDALEAVKAEVRAEALREAAEEANEVAQARLSDERDTALACRDRILALIPSSSPTDQKENLND